MNVIQKIYGENPEISQTIEWRLFNSSNNGICLQAKNPEQSEWSNILWMKTEGDLVGCDGAQSVEGIETAEDGWKPLIK